MFEKDPILGYSDQSTISPRLYAAAGIGGSLYAGHRYALGHKPGYSSNLYKFLKSAEYKSPSHILRTFGLSEFASSYLPDRLEISHAEIVRQASLTDLGSHLQRLIGDKFKVSDATSGLSFLRTDQSGYMDLISKYPGAEGIKVRFMEVGRYSKSSGRYGAPIDPERFSLNQNRLWESFQNIRRAQRPKGYSGLIKTTVEGFGDLEYQPVFAQVKGQTARSVSETVGRIGFELLERPLRLLSDIGFGLTNRSYNSLVNMPFVGKSRGIVNQLLLKRVLPAYLIAGVALPYADYLLHHAPSNLGIEAYQRAKILRAELTDKVPGARSTTDFYERTVPGPQYGPVALPLGGIFAGSLVHWSRVLKDQFATPQAREVSARIFAKATDPKIFGFLNKKSPIAIGAAIGLGLMAPFIPGMLGSRQTTSELQNIYSGEEPVPVRSGRWWDLGSTPWEGSRIKEFRPHWSVLMKTRANVKSLYGTEENYWAHHPILHPFRYLRDPYYLEERNYQDRPYPITSPAFSNVPLIGPLLAATIGKLVKPPIRMHTNEWNQQDYSLYSTRLEPRGPDALPSPIPQEEFSLKDAFKQEATIFADFIGLPGFIAKTLYEDVTPDPTKRGRNIFLEGSRQMDAASRGYYDLELGAGMFVNPSGELSTFGYTEPYRRFIQRETGLSDANEIRNSMPDWLPGDDYFTNFRVGDPYTKVSNGYARLPGQGYAALHPELEGIDPQDYPDLEKLRILGDVAPYSREFQIFKGKVRKQLSGNTELQIEYQKVIDRVEQVKDSVVKSEERRFTGDVDKVEGHVSSVSLSGFELEEYPGRKFQLSSVGYSAADLSAAALAENNERTRSDVAKDVQFRQKALINFLGERLAPGTDVSLTVPKGSVDHSELIRAVVEVGHKNLNKQLLDQGLAQYRKDLAGPESQAMFGSIGKAIGTFAEQLSFVGDESAANPLRYLPTPLHSKFWQERTALSQYQFEEITGARMRRWQRPIHDFIAPYVRGIIRRVTGEVIVPPAVQERRRLNTLTDMLKYMRALNLASQDPEHRGRYTSQASRTAVGVDQFSSPMFVGSTLSEREAHYFQRFLPETDTEKRQQILSSASPELARILTAQWVAQDARIAQAETGSYTQIGSQGRLFTQDQLEEYNSANTGLGYGDYLRSKEIAEFFSSSGLAVPNTDSSLWNPNLDYEDVKLKIIQNEGYDMHDFNIFDDRAALLWRKPYVDGAVRELTKGDNRSTEELRKSIEQLMLAVKNKNPNVVVAGHNSPKDSSNMSVNITIDEQEKLLTDMRRNPENYD
jgi:hypothetical protein